MHIDFYLLADKLYKDRLESNKPTRNCLPEMPRSTSGQAGEWQAFAERF